MSVVRELPIVFSLKSSLELFNSARFSYLLTKSMKNGQISGRKIPLMVTEVKYLCLPSKCLKPSQAIFRLSFGHKHTSC